MLSVPAIVMKLPPCDWRRLRPVNMTYIAYAFSPVRPAFRFLNRGRGW